MPIEKNNVVAMLRLQEEKLLFKNGYTKDKYNKNKKAIRSLIRKLPATDTH